MASGGITGALVAGVKSAARAVGFTPATLDVAASVYASPFPTESELEQLMLRELFALGDRIVVTESTAMALDVVSRVTFAVSGTIGRLRLTDEKAGKRNPGNFAGGVRPFLAQPDPSVPLASTLNATARQLVFYPTADWVVLSRDAFDWPRTARLVPRGDRKVDDSGNLVEAWGAPVAARDVIRFDSPTGGLLSHGADTIRRAVVVGRAAAIAEDNPVPSFELHNDGAALNDEEIEAVVRRWSANRRKYGVGYTSKEIKAQAHGQRLEQLLIEGQKRADLMLVRKMGVPAWVADVPVDGASLSYDNRASRNWELIDLALSPYMTAISGRLTLPDVTPAGWTVAFDTDDLTRPDQKTRFETLEIGIRAGFLTLDEARVSEGLPV